MFPWVVFNVTDIFYNSPIIYYNSIQSLLIIQQSKYSFYYQVNQNIGMGSQSSIIDTSDVQNQRLKPLAPLERRTFCPPFRKFNNQMIKTENKYIQITLQIIQPNIQQITVKQIIFKDMEDAFQQKTRDIQLVSVLSDDLYTDMRTFLAQQKGKQITLQIKPFTNYNTFLYCNILYEIHINQVISQLNCPKLNTIIEKYIIETGLESQGQENPNSQIYVLSPITTNLSEIIKYRRQNKWPWSTDQFHSMAFDLCCALQKLHASNIAHNDIRPCNVFYSSIQSSYQLGCFANAIKIQKNQNKGLMYASQMRTSLYYEAPQLKTNKQSNLQSSDVYALGITLLNAFFLCQPLQSKIIGDLVQRYESRYTIISLIKKMLLPVESRSSIKDILKAIPYGQKPKKIKNLFESLKYKNTPKQKHLVASKKIISEGYQRLGLWNQWKDKLYEAYELQQNQIDDYKKACSLYELAKIQSCRGSYQFANHQAKLASKLFRNLGYSAYDQGNINQSLNFFSKAIQCSKYYQDLHDMDMAKSLQGLALIHAQKGQYQLSKPLVRQASSIVVKTVGKNSVDYGKIRMSQAKIQSDFGQFQLADSILNQCLTISTSIIKNNEKQGQKLRAEVLHQLGRNSMLQSSYTDVNHQIYLGKAQKYLSQSLLLNQKFPDNYLQLANNYETLGQIQLRKQNYIGARSHFKKVQQLRQMNAKMKNLNSNIISVIRQKQRAQTLCNIAACQTGMGSNTQAIKKYNQALQIYRHLYGSDHNKFSAIAIGNMSKVYFKLNQKGKSDDCLNLACQILQDLLGTDDPDYQHFKYLKETS